MKKKPLPVMQSGRTHRFPTIQVRIGKQCHGRLLRYCRRNKLYLSQILTNIVDESLDRLGASKA